MLLPLLGGAPESPGPVDPRECPPVDTVEPKPHVAAPGVGSHVSHSHIGHTYLDGLVGTSGRIEPDEGTRADLIEPDEPVRVDSEVINERSFACRWEFPSLDGGTVKDANDAAVARVVPHSARGVGRHGIQACIVRRQAPPKRSEEHTSELQSLAYLVCRLLLEKKKK